ncbi:MAG: MFS transporter [Rhodobiaceae bacterium]|nr:MFS transporter [Rhodobiaceae bacterium]
MTGEKDPSVEARMRLILFTMAGIGFASAMPIRCLDPVLPQIAKEFAISDHDAAYAAVAFGLPFALVQPFLGPVADLFGKLKMIKVCVFTLALMLLASALAPSFWSLIVIRVFQGVASGGIFPISLALVSDIVPVKQRQVLASRIMATTLTGNVLGATVGGVIGDFAGWRTTMLLLFVLIFIAGGLGAYSLRGIKAKPKKFELANLARSYTTIFRNPISYICYPVTFLEGICVFGILPFVATLLAQQGEPRYSVAGLLLGCFALGGVIYAMSVTHLLRFLRERGVILFGGLLMASQLFIFGVSVPWQYEIAGFLALGWGLYMYHGTIQIYVTEIAPDFRATAVALYATAVFLGQAVGIMIYGQLLDTIDRVPTLFAGGITILLCAVVASALLRNRERD